MRTMIRILMAAAWMAVLAFSVGCEDSGLTAGKDFTMALEASPATVFLDPNQGVSTATATIVATIVDAAGIPQSGLTVFFTKSSGVLASGDAGVKTDGAGRATNTLTVREQDETEISVIASSAKLTQTVKVARTTNHPPVAIIVATPQTEQQSGGTVVFDGSSSTDAEGDAITTYRWDIRSSNPDSPQTNPIFHAEGAGLESVSFPRDAVGPLTNEQALDVKLEVASGVPPSWSPQVLIPYQIRCRNTKPTAVISGAATRQLPGTINQIVSLQLDGTLSSDPETPIESWTWSCDGEFAPIPGDPPSQAVCKYKVKSTSQTYTATLQVKDRGTGPSNPTTGTFPCQQTSALASVQVVVSPTALGGL